MLASVVIHVFTSPRRFAYTSFSRCLVDFSCVTSSVLIVRKHHLSTVKLDLRAYFSFFEDRSFPRLQSKVLEPK